MENPNEPLELVFNSENMIQETLVVDELKKAGIDPMIQSFVDVAYDDIYTKNLGYSRIFTLKHQAEAAKKIVEEVISIATENDLKNSCP